MGRRISWRWGAAALLVCMLALQAGGVAHAYNFRRALKQGTHGRAVRALEMRLAGWYPGERRYFPINRDFGPKTTRAVKAFQRRYGLTVDGIAGRQTFRVLNRLEDRNGSTLHFNWNEFDQNRNSGCSAQANAYAGTFGGGPVPARRTRRNVRRLMWRLEAIRAKGGSNPIGINSGYRSVAYNDCIGGARASQHLYGTGADQRMANVANDRQRRIARHSQVHGIICYARLSHNHFDIRMHNADLDTYAAWYWPNRDSRGRDIAEDGGLCWGEGGTRAASTTASATSVDTRPATDDLVPSVAEVEAFESAGEPEDLGGLD